jgi:hypothetical protein
MLRKSADTQLRSNYLVETDGGTGRGIDGFPTTQQYALLKMRVTSFKNTLQATSLNSCRTPSGITSNIRLKSRT